MSNNILRQGASRAVIATMLLGGFTSGPAWSQQVSDNELKIDEVVVTGSYIRRDSFNSPVPTSTVDKSEIDAQGVPTMIDLVKNLTINTGSEFNTYGFAQSRTTGTAQINLRGLGLGSTLVLINGRRTTLGSMTANDGSQFVDINNFPINMVERIELVKDGASALYGSDAVAGVANFITRDVNGIEFDGSFQTTTKSSQEDISFSVAAGGDINRGHVNIFYSYFERSELNFGERDFTAGSLVRPVDKPGTFLLLGAAPDAGPRRDPDCAAAGSEPRGPILCFTDISTAPALISPESRHSVFADVEYELTDELTFNGELNYARNRAERTGPPSFPMLRPGGFDIPADHPNNPFGVPLRTLNVAAIGFNEGEPTRAYYGSETMRTAASLNYELSGNWYIDAGFVYAFTDGFNKFTDQLADQTQLYLNGGPDGNTYLNIFGSAITDPAAANSQEVLDAITGQIVRDGRAAHTSFDLVASGDVFELPGGPVGIALGAQYRKETLSNKFDTDSRRDNFVFQSQSLDFEGSTEAFATFGEVALPVVDGVNVSAAVRYEDYNGNTGSTVDPKVGVSYAPNDDLMFRASYGTSMRAPNPNHLFSNTSTIQTLTTNCDGTARNGVQSVINGNRNLSPENSTAYGFGASASPVKGLSISADYWRYKYEDIIVTDNAQTIINDACAAGGVETDARITSAAGVVSRIDLAYKNDGTLKTDGIDIELRYRFDGVLGGAMELGNQTSYIMNYDVTQDGVTTGGAGNRNRNNFGRSTPQWRSNTSLSWMLGNHFLRASGRYVDSYKDDVTGGLNDDGTISSTFFIDLQYSFNIEGLGNGSAITFGVNNLTNVLPPAANGAGGYDPQIYDPRGRLVYTRFHQAF